MSTIESVLQETRVFPLPAELQKTANVPGLAAYKAMCDEAERDLEGFWAKHAKNELMWDKPFTKTLDESNAPFFKWFHDGELNASRNCLDRHLKTQPDKVAIIFQADDGKVTKVTYKGSHRVCQFANALKARGIQKGERVLIYMPMSIEAVVAMQPARASAPRTRWFSAAFPRRACRSASWMRAPWQSSPPMDSIAARRSR
jgi:acetyl-CoA synthetase